MGIEERIFYYEGPAVKGGRIDHLTYQEAMELQRREEAMAAKKDYVGKLDAGRRAEAENNATAPVQQQPQGIPAQTNTPVAQDQQELQSILDAIPPRGAGPLAGGAPSTSASANGAGQQDIFSNLAAGRDGRYDSGSAPEEVLSVFAPQERTRIEYRLRNDADYTMADMYKEAADAMAAKRKFNEEKEKAEFDEGLTRGTKELEHKQDMEQAEYGRGTQLAVAETYAGGQRSRNSASRLGSYKELETKAAELRMRAADPASGKNPQIAMEAQTWTYAAEHKKKNPGMSNDDALQVGKAMAQTDNVLARFIPFADATAAQSDPKYWEKIRDIIYGSIMGGISEEKTLAMLRSRSRTQKSLPQ